MPPYPPISLSSAYWVLEWTLTKHLVDWGLFAQFTIHNIRNPIAVGEREDVPMILVKPSG